MGGDLAFTLGNFRQISLVGSIYKFVLKVLPNRLDLIMDKIIPANQSSLKGENWWIAWLQLMRLLIL